MPSQAPRCKGKRRAILPPMRILVLVLLTLSACGSRQTPPGAGLSTCDHLVNDDGHLRMVRCCSDAGC
jgi:hypothetical protein